MKVLTIKDRDLIIVFFKSSIKAYCIESDILKQK
jgi:hypothetical protein